MNGSRSIYNCQFCDDFETKKLKRKIGFRRKTIGDCLVICHRQSTVLYSLCHGTSCDINNAILKGTKKGVEQPSLHWVISRNWPFIT